MNTATCGLPPPRRRPPGRAMRAGAAGNWSGWRCRRFGDRGGAGPPSPDWSECPCLEWRSDRRRPSSSDWSRLLFPPGCNRGRGRGGLHLGDLTPSSPQPDEGSRSTPVPLDRIIDAVDTRRGPCLGLCGPVRRRPYR